MAIKDYKQLTSQTANFTNEDRSISNSNLIIHKQNLTSLQTDVSNAKQAINTNVDSIKNLINDEVITNYLSLIKDSLNTIDETKMSQVLNSLSQIETKYADLERSLNSLDTKFIDIESKIEQKVDQAAQKLTNDVNSLYNDYLNKYEELIDANVVQLQATIEVYVNNMNRLMLQTIDACNSVTTKFNQYIVELGVKSDTYLTAIDGFSSAAQTTSDITRQLSESVVNLQSAITQISNKVNQLETGLVNLTELSMTFNKTLERKLKAVDVADIIEDATTSLLNIKNTFKKEKGDL